MKRKVVKQGTSTLMVSLPSDWASRLKIKKGDELEVDAIESTLLISTRKEHFDKETELNIDDLSPMIQLSGGAIFRAGYDRLKLTFSEPNRIADVNDTVRDEFSGFEIIEQGKTYCIIKKIEEGMEGGFELVLRRSFLLLLSMAEEGFEALKSSDYKEFDRLMQLERANNRLTNYCMRFLAKKGYEKPGKVQFIHYIIEQLEKLADEYWFLFAAIKRKYSKGAKPSKDVLEYYKTVNESLRLFYELFYKFDKKKLVKIGETYYSLMGYYDEVSKTDLLMNGKDAAVIHRLANIEEFTFSMVGPYLSLVL